MEAECALHGNAGLQRCSSHDNHYEDPSSDLYALVVGEFAQVGWQLTPADEKHQRVTLGNAHVRGFKAAVHALETQATKKYGSYRVLENNEATRLRILKQLHEHFLNNDERTTPVSVLLKLGIENNQPNRRVVGKAMEYWIDGKAVLGKSIGMHDGEVNVTVTGMVNVGTKIAEGRPEHPPLVQHISAENIGVIGTMTGGTITQNAGGSFSDLAAALDKLRAEMQYSDEPLASAVEATAEKGAALARVTDPDRGAIVRNFTALCQLIQTLGATPQAWAFLAAEAVKIGFNMPGPPALPQ